MLTSFLDFLAQAQPLPTVVGAMIILAGAILFRGPRDRDPRNPRTGQGTLMLGFIILVLHPLLWSASAVMGLISQ